MTTKKRRLNLIHILAQQTEYRTINYFSDALQVSKRTIRNDIDFIENRLENYDLEIKKIPNIGVFLKGSSFEKEKLVNDFESDINGRYQDSYLRIAEIVKILLLEEKTVTFQELSEELFVSTTILSRDFKLLKKFETNQAKIISDRNGTRFEGTEYSRQKYIRDFFNMLVNQKNIYLNNIMFSNFLKQYFSAEIVDTIFRIINELNNIIYTGIDNPYTRSILIFLVVILTRAIEGNHIKNDCNMLQQNNIELLANYPFTIELIELIKENLDIDFTDNEINYISFQLFIHRIEPTINSKYLSKIFHQDVSYLIDYISKGLGLKLDQDNKLYDSLTYHLIPLLYRVQSAVKIKNPLLEQIKKSYSKLFYLVWYGIQEIEGKYKISLNEDEISFIVIHFQVAIERFHFKNKMYVVCASGLITSELIVSKIKKSLPASVEVEVLSIEELGNKSAIDADFIISTIDLPNRYEPFLHVSPVLTEKELQQIYNFYIKYALKKEDDQSSLISSADDIIKKENIIIHQEFNSKQELFEYCEKILLKRGVVNEGFKQSLMERENMGNTCIAPNVSMPHSSTEYVNEATLLIITLKRPIVWNSMHDVDVVFLLALNNEDVSDYVNVLPKIHNKVLDFNIYTKIKTSTDKVEIMMILGDGESGN